MNEQQANSQFQQEIGGQPDALRQLADFYTQGDGVRLLANLLPADTPLLTGMGASYHAAWVGATHAHALGIRAAAVEAVDLLNYHQAMLQPGGQLVYLSQSGRSGEVTPVVARLPEGMTLVGVTNDLESPLAAHANVALPLVAGDETLIASKTYVNSLALVWLLVREWGKIRDGSEAGTLHAAADTIERLIAAQEASVALWQETLSETKTLVFLGHGPHAATARHSAMMMSEWAKVPALSAGVGAFHHGFIESTSADTGFVVFAPPGRTAESAHSLAQRLQSYGARGLVVVNGVAYRVDDASRVDQGFDEFLSPLLDILPVQMYADALVWQRGVTPGFRYLSKVVTRL